MTPRDHYKIIYSQLEESEFSDNYCDILECEDLKEVRELTHKLYDTLKTTINSNQDDFYKDKKKYLADFTKVNDGINTINKIEDIKAFATYFYDAIVVEKIREYAYNVHLKGGINNYVQLASDIQDLYLDELKEEGMYDEWRGAEYPDVDCSIGDGPKLELSGKENRDYLEPREFDKSILKGIPLNEHIENIVKGFDFQDSIDSILDALESDDIDYVKGMLCAFHSDYFNLLSKLYCYENDYSQKLAREIDVEYSRVQANMESDGCDDYEIMEHWVRDEEEQDEDEQDDEE